MEFCLRRRSLVGFISMALSLTSLQIILTITAVYYKAPRYSSDWAVLQDIRIRVACSHLQW